MATANRIQVSKDVIGWAFDTTDLTQDEKDHVRIADRWLDTDSPNYLRPTVRQLGQFATRLHVPFGALVLPDPPAPEDIRAAFRTEKNAPARVSLTLRDVIHEMKRKQSWFRDESGLATDVDWIGRAAGATVAQTTLLLGQLLHRKHFSDVNGFYRDLREQMATLGILTMQKGGAGLGNNRPLDVAEVRAFVLLDPRAPLIFINQKDSYTARIFSLVHEFVHLLRGSDELLGKERDVQEERDINAVVARFLLPKQDFIEKFRKLGLAKSARYFGVSSETAAIRAQRLGLIQTMPVIEEPTYRATSGGNAYNNALSANDRRYMAALVAASNRGSVQPTQTASLIGISLKMLHKTVEMFNFGEAQR